MADYHTRLEKRRKQKPLWKKVIFIIFLLGLIPLLAGGGLFTYYASQAPALNEKALQDPVPSKIFDKNGELIATIGAKERELVDYEEIPPLVEAAVLATEDARFYDHPGVDPLRIGAAVIANLKEGFGAQGASTITQQVIKRSFLTPEKSLERKAQEAWMALKFERTHKKEEILELYLNKIYYSDNIYGIKTAARYYYNKKLDELTLAQAALLAGIPQSPNNYNPYDYPNRAETRRNIVLALMEHHGKISKAEKETAQQVPVTAGLVKRTPDLRYQLTVQDGYQAFVDAVISRLEKEGEYDLYQDGLRVYTTMDPGAQRQVEALLNSEKFINYPEAKNDQPFQAGVTLLDTKTGAVRAIGGGRDYGKEKKRTFNFALDIQRQPGSLMKPLLAYGPAIEKMQWSTAHILEDEPFTYENGKEPQNWDGEFKGSITMREALWDSRNIPAIKTFNEVGHDYAAAFASRLGIELENPLYESAAIGGIRSSINTLEMAGAYAAFGNGGKFHEPYFITKIEFRDSTSISKKPEGSQVMKDYTAYMITDMLKDVIRHSEATGNKAEVPGLPVAGKTGTTGYSEEMRDQYDLESDYASDAWFVGYTPHYTAAVWTGYKDLPNYLTKKEQETAEKLFATLMEQVSAGTETPDFEQPASVIEVEIEKGSNPPERADSSSGESEKITELFVKGTEPKQTEEDEESDTAKKTKEDQASDKVRKQAGEIAQSTAAAKKTPEPEKTASAETPVKKPVQATAQSPDPDKQQQHRPLEKPGSGSEETDQNKQPEKKKNNMETKKKVEEKPDQTTAAKSENGTKEEKKKPAGHETAEKQTKETNKEKTMKEQQGTEEQVEQTSERSENAGKATQNQEQEKQGPVPEENGQKQDKEQKEKVTEETSTVQEKVSSPVKPVEEKATSHQETKTAAASVKETQGKTVPANDRPAEEKKKAPAAAENTNQTTDTEKAATETKLKESAENSETQPVRPSSEKENKKEAVPSERKTANPESGQTEANSPKMDQTEKKKTDQAGNGEKSVPAEEKEQSKPANTEENRKEKTKPAPAVEKKKEAA